MRATFMYGAGDVRVEHVPDPKLFQPTDALVRVVLACVCGSDLHPYRGLPTSDRGRPMGHEFLGVVEEAGSQVHGFRPGDLVVAPFAYCDNTCEFCREGFQTSCRHGGFWAAGDVGGGQAEAVRVPLADGTLVKLPVGEDSALLPSLLTLSDVYGTGHHAALRAGVNARTTVTVIGDGAVGLLAVLAARRLGAERMILMGRHKRRTDLGREFGATEVVAERGEEGIAKVRDLTGGDGTHTVLECVGHKPAYEQAFGVVRVGGVVSRVGVPQYDEAPVGWGMFGRNLTLTGGPAPVRAYIEELMPDVLDGTVQPGRVFDRTVSLDETPDAYRAMDRREALRSSSVPENSRAGGSLTGTVLCDRWSNLTGVSAAPAATDQSKSGWTRPVRQFHGPAAS
jgi:threonine dehydrogenase-like Zn-dependent dehydrogenase